MLDQDITAEVQGRDWSQYLQEQTVPDDNYSLYASYHVFGNWPAQAAACGELYQAREARGIRSEQFTYVEDLKGPWLLYDNIHDPLQQKNLIGNEQHQHIQDEHAQYLRSQLNELDDQFHPGNDYVAAWSYEVNESGTIPFEGWYG